MKSITRLFFSFIALQFFVVAASAQDSSRLRISLLTCTPGDELYSLFGHSAIRVTDSNAVTDIVYNYGTFNFDDDGFYVKFVRGKLLYYLSVAYFPDFQADYQFTNRGMREQLLNLSAVEKTQLNHALIQNLQEENKYYQYDFFFDNCTTRLRDLIERAKSPTPILPAVMPLNTTFRQAIHQYLDAGQQHWSKLGIDILLGAKTDGVMTAKDQEFLPDNLMRALDSVKNTSLVKSNKKLYTLPDIQKEKIWFTPFVIFSLLLLFYVICHFFVAHKFPLFMHGLDGMLFFLTGLLGILLIFMWVGTDHSMTKNNYNLLWALPTHIFFSFLVTQNLSWVKQYFGFSAVAGILLLCAWYFLPQKLNPAMIPFVLLLIFRSYVIFRSRKPEAPLTRYVA